MTTVPLTFDIDAESARVFAGLDEQQRLKAEVLLRIHFRDIVRALTDPNAPTLIEAMDGLAAEAAKNGLTEEELESILNEPSDAGRH